MKRAVLHCDMNNFYASVECLINPSIADMPVAVCGSTEERHGIVLAKNYKARAFGITTGEPVQQALKKCGKLVIASPRYDEYVKYSKLARQIYSRYTYLIEPYGLDECWLDISGTRRLFGTPEEVAHKIKSAVKNELGLSISVGVSFNKVFAKLGSDMKKPDAVTVITRENFRDKTGELPVSDMIGAGPATTARLSEYGIFTLGQLARCSGEWIDKLFGKSGVSLWHYANGRDYSPVTNQELAAPIKSVGHGVTTVSDLENAEQVKTVFLELAQDVGHRLRKHKMAARSVCISVRDNALAVSQWQAPVGVLTQSPTIIAFAAYELFCKNYRWDKNIRSLSVTATDLIPQDTPYQMGFSESAVSYERLERLDECIEKIRRRFGNDIVKNAVLMTNRKVPTQKPCMTLPTAYV